MNFTFSEVLLMKSTCSVSSFGQELPITTVKLLFLNSSIKSNSLFYCLGTLDVDLIDEKITLNNEHGPKLERINDE